MPKLTNLSILKRWKGYAAYVIQCRRTDQIWDEDLKNPYTE